MKQAFLDLPLTSHGFHMGLDELKAAYCSCRQMDTAPLLLDIPCGCLAGAPQYPTGKQRLSSHIANRDPFRFPVEQQSPTGRVR